MEPIVEDMVEDAAFGAETAAREKHSGRIGVDEFIGHYEVWREPVYRFIRLRCASDEDAADLTATAFERAWVARGTFRGPSDAFAGWIFRIARRLSIDAARRQTRARGWLAFLPVPPPAPDPADLVLADEADRLLVARLADLNALQREALLLRFAAGLSARQIGAVIGKSEAATQKLITRGLARLKEVYRDDE